MSEQNTSYYAFNRGLVSALGLARGDIKRLAMSAERSVNWMPRVLGSMMLRPGLQYINATEGNNTVRQIPFVFSTSDTARIELTDHLMRVAVNDSIITRPAVSTAILNGTFDTNLTDWTSANESGAASAWVTGGYMGLTGTGTNAGIRYQLVTVALGDQGVEHALRIIIERGPVTLRVGSTLAGDEYINETNLDTGVHSLAFTPTGDFYVQFQSRLKRQVLVDECTIEPAGTMEIETPWGAADLSAVRGAQSGDIIFVGCVGMQQWAIERRATTSWSVVLYAPEDGPFLVENVGPTTLTASALSGNGTLTASTALFKAGHVGSLWSLTSTGQRVTTNVTAQNQFTSAISVEGVGSDRIFTINISGTWTATVTLQRSLTSDSGPWSDVPGKTWTANTTETFTDGLDNQIAYYRIGVKTGDFTSGTVVLELSINTGSVRGVVRITSVTNATSAAIEIITDLGGTTATDIWEEGEWSGVRGYPTAPALYEGRLWWAGKDKTNGSVSDGFYSYDPTVEGDSAPISRSIGTGQVDTINWILPLLRLVLGADGREHSCRSTSFDEPLTPTNFNIKTASSQGSAAVEAVAIDDEGVYVQRGGTRVYKLTWNGEKYDYRSEHLSAIVPNIGQPRIIRMAVQRQPDTRIHFVRSDGTAAVLVFDSAENVACWLDIESDGAGGLIEDVCVLPGAEGDFEDQVYYAIARTIGGNTVRYIEKWATEEECQGGIVNRQADSFATFANSPASTIVTGFSHLAGESVVVWADGVCPTDNDGNPKLYPVSGAGNITLDTAAAEGMAGLPYTARWQSAKLLALQTQKGSPLNRHTNINAIGLVLGPTHAKGLKFGPDFDHLDDMPSVDDGAPVDGNSVWRDYDKEPIVFPGKWSTDSRICLEAAAPRPVTILAATVTVEMNE